MGVIRARVSIASEVGVEADVSRLYDLSRAGMLKFSLQVRIGDMDGIFLAYHNTTRIYGFQYLPLEEIDRKLFGSTAMAESAFRICVALWESVVQRIVECFPGKVG